MNQEPQSPARSVWRSLEELAGAPEFRDRLAREFPDNPTEWNDPVSRRHFLSLMGASIALAGLTGCTSAPPSEIVPYSRGGPSPTPGQPQMFATAMTVAGVALGLLVRSNDGRPTKVEGNPSHPSSLGATDAFAQAAILELYDPDRSQTVTHRGQPSSWAGGLGALRTAMNGPRRHGGRGLAILTETISSPTLGDWMIGPRTDSLRSAFPEARWYQYEPASHDAGLQGTRRAFGRPLEAVYDLRQADVVVTLDADLFDNGPQSVRWSRDFAERRRAERMNRLYAIESTPTLTGATADHRLVVRCRDVEQFARALAAALGLRAEGAGDPRWIQAIARDLQSHRGAGLVVPGEHQPPAVHALAHAINLHLGNVGRAVRFIEPIGVGGNSHSASLNELVDEMVAGRVHVLLILGGNPVYTAPADLAFETALRHVPNRFHLGLYADETAAACHWHLPQAHFLESWGDARSADGTATLIQPLIAPLHSGRTSAEVLGFLLTGSEQNAVTLTRDYWRDHWPRPSHDFDRDWRQAVHDGFIAHTAFVPIENLTLADDWLARPPPPLTGTELIFRTDPAVYDGRFANNGWLQELPKPLTKLTWGNAALMSPAMAERLGVRNRLGVHAGEHGETIAEMVELRVGNRSVEAPVWIMPGHPDNSVTIHLGHGRTRGGRVARDVGFNAYRLRTSAAPSFSGGLEVTRLGATMTLACTQAHHAMEGRDLVRTVRVGGPPDVSDEHQEPHDRRLIPLTLYRSPDYGPSENQWGMVIDLARCTGCSACVVACQAENNIPVVGKTEVTRGREMHWIRVDRYHEGDEANPATHFQPVPCMHCENAPCEVVCPVAATAHSADGLNDMVYNRCVGTRYCSNNCPYKVRRFNFLDYSDFRTEVVRLGRNPDVTVRSRGVMEKCTYCVQRIRQSQFAADIDGRPMQDGDVVTACQQACPAQAIVFGNINDRGSQVSQARANPRNYSLLAELNTRPRTTYLAGLRNPNPELNQ